jgi:hypothetical protein
MIQRFARDESGMTLGLAMILVLIIGIMGAGLLTFANTNLNTVVEANRGQRAFEVADAGIEAARRQLTYHCTGSSANSACVTFYNDDEGDAGGDDIQWSIAKGGLTLNDLDGEGVTEDSVTVTIDYREFEATTNDFKVISTGTYGDSKRKIEAIFKPITPGGGGGGNVINPAYYTTGDILLNWDPVAREGVDVKGMSLFSEGNIIIERLTSAAGTESTSFKNEYERSNDADMLTITNGNRVLGDWDSTLYDPPGNWNDIGRRDSRNRMFDGPGFGAEGMICGSNGVSPINCDDPSDSIAEGRYGYDSTTGPINGLTGASQTPKGQGLTFVDKAPLDDTCGTGPDCYGPNTPGTITYPFERRTPDAARLKQLAINTDGWYRGSNPDWDTLLAGDRSRVVFIDAQNATAPITLEGGGGTKKGIIVVWCGTLEMTNVGSFQGVIMSLNGQGDLLPPDPETGSPSSSCSAPQGRLSVVNSDLKAWFYAEGGDVTTPGVQLGPGTQIDFLPSGTWKLLDLILEDAVPTSFEVQGWRELYQ